MAIRFPKMHIAESVANRIMNLRDELQASQPLPATPAAAEPPPPAPDPALSGLALDDTLAQPTPPVDTPPDGQIDPLVGTVARGEDLRDTAFRADRGLF